MLIRICGGCPARWLVLDSRPGPIKAHVISGLRRKSVSSLIHLYRSRPHRPNLNHFTAPYNSLSTLWISRVTSPCPIREKRRYPCDSASSIKSTTKNYSTIVQPEQTGLQRLGHVQRCSTTSGLIYRLVSSTSRSSDNHRVHCSSSTRSPASGIHEDYIQ